MHVARPSSPLAGDTAIDAIIAAALDRKAVLVAGAPGFGKSSVLAAASRQLRVKEKTRTIWLSGGIIASEAHLVALLAESVGRPEWSGLPLSGLCNHLSKGTSPLTLAIDDFDALVFKREPLSVTIGGMFSRHPFMRLIGTGLPAACERLVNPAHPFFLASGGRVNTITLQPMNSQTALALIRRRVPRLAFGSAREVIQAAGGHPAALVFLARLAELRPPGEQSDLRRLFERAAEFAGAVYSESWASLGPQQRAVLWELSVRSTATAAEVATAIHLPASHVSAQISRLVADGLVRREEQRGQYSVAPLLAGWVARRAARNERTTTRVAETIGGVERYGDAKASARGSIALSAPPRGVVR